MKEERKNILKALAAGHGLKIVLTNNRRVYSWEKKFPGSPKTPAIEIHKMMKVGQVVQFGSYLKITQQGLIMLDVANKGTKINYVTEPKDVRAAYLKTLEAKVCEEGWLLFRNEDVIKIEHHLHNDTLTLDDLYNLFLHRMKKEGWLPPKAKP